MLNYLLHCRPQNKAQNKAQNNELRQPLYTLPILLLALTVSVSYLGLGFVMPLRALYSQQFGATSGEIGVMASSALLTGFLAAAPVGALTDRFGPRTILWLGLLAHGILVLSYAFVQNPVALIGLRALEGIALVAVLPPSRTLMNVLAPVTRQGEALGLLSSAQLVGILLGPALGAVLASAVGFVPAFIIACVPLFLGALSAWLFLPRQKLSVHLAFATSTSPTSRQSSPLAKTNSPGASIASIDKRSEWHKQFMPQLWLVYILAAVLAITQGTITAIWSLYMVARGSSLPVLGLSYTTYALPAMVLTPFAGRLSDRHGRYWPILGSFACYTAIYFVFGLPISPFWLVVFSAIEGIVGGIVGSALSGLLADVMSTEGRGKAQANFSAATTLGSFLSATGAGFLYAISPGAPFIASSAVFVLACVALCLPPVIRLFPAANRQIPTIATSIESTNQESDVGEKLVV